HRAAPCPHRAGPPVRGRCGAPLVPAAAGLTRRPRGDQEIGARGPAPRRPPQPPHRPIPMNGPRILLFVPLGVLSVGLRSGGRAHVSPRARVIGRVAPRSSRAVRDPASGGGAVPGIASRGTRTRRVTSRSGALHRAFGGGVAHGLAFPGNAPRDSTGSGDAFGGGTKRGGPFRVRIQDVAPWRRRTCHAAPGPGALHGVAFVPVAFVPVAFGDSAARSPGLPRCSTGGGIVRGLAFLGGVARRRSLTSDTTRGGAEREPAFRVRAAGSPGLAGGTVRGLPRGDALLRG